MIFFGAFKNFVSRAVVRFPALVYKSRIKIRFVTTIPNCNAAHLEVGRSGLEVLPCWASGGLWEWLPCVGVKGVEFIVVSRSYNKAFQAAQTCFTRSFWTVVWNSTF
jgi:hypothetical protein